MDQPGTIAAVTARLDFLERRVVALEADKAALLDLIKALRGWVTGLTAAMVQTNEG